MPRGTKGPKICQAKPGRGEAAGTRPSSGAIWGPWGVATHAAAAAQPEQKTGYLKAVWPEFSPILADLGPVSGQSLARDRYRRPRLEKCCINQQQLARETDSKPDWVPEGSLAGFLGAFLRSGRPRGPGKAFKSVGGFASDISEGFPGPPGPARPQKRNPQTPARLPSGTQQKGRQ